MTGNSKYQWVRRPKRKLEENLRIRVLKRVLYETSKHLLVDTKVHALKERLTVTIPIIEEIKDEHQDEIGVEVSQAPRGVKRKLKTIESPRPAKKIKM